MPTALPHLLITISSDFLGGTPVFTGTRVPVKTLFDYLEAGDPLDEFLHQFPDVDREHAVAVIKLAARHLLPVPEAAEWFAGLKNGALLAAIAGKFDVFVTVDQSLRHQQNLSSINFGIVVLSVPSNRLGDVRATLANLVPAIAAAMPGQLVMVV